MKITRFRLISKELISGLLNFLGGGKSQLKKMLILLLLFLNACSNGSSSSELIVLDKLKNNPIEDFFMLNNSVYIKTDEVIEFENQEINKVGEITKAYKGNKKFENGMATTLTVGTSLYRSIENNETELLYIKIEDGYIQYQAEAEG